MSSGRHPPARPLARGGTRPTRWCWVLRVALAAALTAGTPLSGVADPEDHADAAALDPDYAAGKEALEHKDWAEAVRRFGRAALRDPANADVHNYLGYAHRHLGQLDRAFTHYKRALALNPRHRGAHEYVGEAYLMVGDLASAEKHLEELRAICLLPCEELADLEREITEYRTKSGAHRPR